MKHFGKALFITTALFLLATSLSACGEKKRPPAPVATTQAPTTTVVPNPVGAPPPVKITEIAKLDRPTALATRRDDPTLYVAERPGVIRAIRDNAVLPDPVLDIRNEVSTDGETGLLGLTFALDKPTFYVHFNDKNRDTHIVEFALGADGRVDPHSRRELLTIKQPPFSNHKGGQLATGPDGLLYIGMGDGGGSGDPSKNGQNLSVLLGKILRINPQPSTTAPYTVPFDNPLVKQSGARPEIWYYGLRNPWRFSFDRSTKAMWIADVGQNAWEEINRVDYDPKGGKNFGWSLREGTRRFDGDKPRDAVDPVHEYSHSGGACSVTGGYVYDGVVMPDTKARYLFADFCTGQLSALTQRGSSWSADPLSAKVEQIASFGQDNAGELYVLSLNGLVGRIEPG